MEINQVKTTRLPILGEIEVKNATFLNKSFPFHFHKFWSLGFIEMGSEHLSFNQGDILISRHTQILIPPYSLHKNWGEKNSPWTYKAIYINSDVISSLAEELGLDYEAVASLPYLIDFGSEQGESAESFLVKTLKKLLLLSKRQVPSVRTSSSKECYIDELIHYLSVNYHAKITLNKLESQFKVNKFKLLRSFKNKVGISPLAYQLSIRIEKSKQLFFEDIPLTHIALESGFFDQSHFTRNFKRYVGVTPGDFKKNCNILQDQGGLSR